MPTLHPIYRLILCAGLAVGYLAYRHQGDAKPTPVTPTPSVPQVAELVDLVKTMTTQDKTALREAHQILARSIDADPAEEPVFDTVLAIRQAYRAALLCVWKGVLNNPPGKYPGLREALEGAVQKRLGSDDAAVSPPIRHDAVAVLNEIAGTIK
jgi:hypothetical protein